MAEKQTTVSKTEALIIPLLDAAGFELYDLEYVREAGNWFLRAYIDKEGGITLNDCEKINRELSDLLDKEDFIEESYILEVSSPGIDRKLKKDKDFERALGELIDIHLYKSVKLDIGRKKPMTTKVLSGILKAFDENSITIEYNGSDMTVDRTDVSIVRMGTDF